MTHNTRQGRCVRALPPPCGEQRCGPSRLAAPIVRAKPGAERHRQRAPKSPACASTARPEASAATHRQCGRVEPGCSAPREKLSGMFTQRISEDAPHRPHQPLPARWIDRHANCAHGTQGPKQPRSCDAGVGLRRQADHRHVGPTRLVDGSSPTRSIGNDASHRSPTEPLMRNGGGS